jgi:hypothetical protein
MTQNQNLSTQLPFPLPPSDLLYLTTAIISSIIMLISSLFSRKKITQLRKINQLEYLRRNILDIVEENGSVDIDILAKKFNTKPVNIINLIKKDLGKTLYLTIDGKTLISKQYIKKIILKEVRQKSHKKLC